MPVDVTPYAKLELVSDTRVNLALTRLDRAFQVKSVTGTQPVFPYDPSYTRFLALPYGSEAGWNQTLDIIDALFAGSTPKMAIRHTANETMNRNIRKIYMLLIAAGFFPVAVPLSDLSGVAS